MKEEDDFYGRMERVMDDRVKELVEKYAPGIFFEKWVKEFQVNFRNAPWRSEEEMDLTLNTCLYWIECLLKTWRGEIGPINKSLNRKRGDLGQLSISRSGILP